MKDRPFRELTKDWSPQRKARVAAMTTQLADELETEKRERHRGHAPRKRSSSQPAPRFTPHPRRRTRSRASSVAGARSSQMEPNRVAAYFTVFPPGPTRSAPRPPEHVDH